MKETKFTKGPWCVTSNSAGSLEVVMSVNGVPVSFNGDAYLCISPTSSNGDYEDCTHGATATANANLIAAAPEMYEALELMLGQFDSEVDCINEADYIAIKAANDALAKARGEHD